MDRRFNLAVTIVAALVMSALLVPVAFSHPMQNPTCVPRGCEQPPRQDAENDVPMDGYSQLGWTFRGPQGTVIRDGPCDNTELVHGGTLPPPAPQEGEPGGPVRDPNSPGDAAPHEDGSSMPHMAHIYGIRNLNSGPWDDPPADWSWVEPGSITVWHFEGYEDPAAIEQPWIGGAGAPSVMPQSDGYFNWHFNMTVPDKNGPDVAVVDYHQHASYCVWARPVWSYQDGGPWIFAGSAFVNDVFDWDNDTVDDFPGEPSGSLVDLELYYEKIFRELYPTWPRDQKVEAFEFLIESSLEKFPAVRAWFEYEVTPFPDWQTAVGKPPTQKDNGQLGMLWDDSKYWTPVDTDYVYQGNLYFDPNPMGQEHWVMLNESAIRYGWPDRELTLITDTTPDPIVAWEWWLDDDPRPALPNGQVYPSDGKTGDDSLEIRACTTNCHKDFPFPNPLEQRKLPQEVYLDDPAYGQDGEYTMCLFVYTNEAVVNGKTPHDGSGQPLPDPAEGSSSLRCQTIIVENIIPVAYGEEKPKYVWPAPGPRTRTFEGNWFDPDGVPKCIEELAWWMDGEKTPFDRVRNDYAENVALGLAAADPDVFNDRWRPEHTFRKDGLVEVNLTVTDCNGGVSEPARIILDIPPNRPPWIEPVEDQRLFVGQQTCWWVVGHDPDGYPLRYLTHKGGPAFTTGEIGMSIPPPDGSNNYNICFLAGIDHIGTFPICLMTADDLGLKGTECFTIQVFNPDADTDGDGIPDVKDLCPAIDDAVQTDSDGDGFGDSCDPDPDGDGLYGDDDLCPNDPLDACVDADGDRVPDHLDNCPGVANVEQADRDGDGVGDACEAVFADRDRDGIEDRSDNCPDTANKRQIDIDLDGIGDLCDDDMDGDGAVEVSDDQAVLLDNCPRIANPDQFDSDGDGIGDRCDPDSELFAGHQVRAVSGSGLDADGRAAVEPKGFMGFGSTAAGVLAGIVILGIIVAGVTAWAMRRWK